MEAHAPTSSTAEAEPVDHLIEAVQKLARTRRPGEIEQIVPAAARRLVDADGASFAVRDGERCLYANEDADQPMLAGERYTLDACPAGWAMENQRALVAEDVSADERVPRGLFDAGFVTSLVEVPVEPADPIATIGCYWRQPHRPSDRELSLLQSLADAVGAAMEHAGARELPPTDELTGLNTRRTFFGLATRAFRAELASEGRCAAVFVDLQNLRHVNDTYGHHIGSALIQEAAAALRGISVEGDVLGRLGGDELALLRPGATASASELHGEIGEAVARASQADLPYGLKVSVGVAVAPARDVGSLDELLSRADLAMTAHKRVSTRRAHVRREQRE